MVSQRQYPCQAKQWWKQLHPSHHLQRGRRRFCSKPWWPRMEISHVGFDPFICARRLLCVRLPSCSLGEYYERFWSHNDYLWTALLSLFHSKFDPASFHRYNHQIPWQTKNYFGMYRPGLIRSLGYGAWSNGIQLLDRCGGKMYLWYWQWVNDGHVSHFS
jgi:hypothetical protein